MLNPLQNVDVADDNDVSLGSKPPRITQTQRKKPGRNLFSATLVGILLGSLVIIPLVFYPRLWFVIVAGAAVVSTHEVCKQLVHLDLDVCEWSLHILGQIIIWSSAFFQGRGLLISFSSAVIFEMMYLLLRRGFKHSPHNYFLSVSASIFLLVWIPVFISFAGMLVLAPSGPARVLSFMLIAVGSDIGGYFAGVKFGKHSMVPTISPKKTWEGFVGSLLFGSAISTVFLTRYAHLSWEIALMSGIITVIVATGGDLIESQIKRDLGIKDMGNLLPEHGGIMDRLDSILPSAAAAWVLWHFLT